MVPASWMPNCRMDRIIVHWTAGTHTASANDKKHYHVLIEGDGKLVRGTPSIAANVSPLIKGYAAHTAYCNSWSIGVSLCGMAGAVERPFSAGKYPLTEVQWFAAIEAIAELAKRYAIPVTPRTILTHAEVQGTLGRKQKGKWDIAALPFEMLGLMGATAVGNEMRRLVAVHLDQLNPARPEQPKKPETLPRYRVVNVSPSTLNWRDGPSGRIVSAIPEGTVVEKLGETSGQWWEVRSPAGYVGWVSSAYLAPA